MNKKIFLLFYIIVCFLNLYGQTDTLQITANQNKWTDIKPPIGLLNQVEQISGSRFTSTQESPFTIFTITQDDLKKHGITSLIEALSLLPGIQTSEIGSSLDGSMFQFRGLNGNNYAKILINDVNIKPFMVGGMPLGEQLPIAFVDRIEVLYGPSATLYGADASAGVINIITKNATRPLSVFGNIRYGSQDYQNINLKFDINKSTSKRTLSFGLYANFSSKQDRNIYYANNPELINYERDVALQFVENFETKNNQIVFANLPHQSQSVGGRAQFGQFSLNFDIMTRQDHSALGFSPHSVSYSNSQNFIGEKITSVNALYTNKENEKFKFKAIGSYLGYRTHQDANIQYVLPTIGLYASVLSRINSPIADGIRDLETTTFGGNQVVEASSNEAGIEVLSQYVFSKYLSLSAGVNARYGKGTPLILFKQIDFELQDDETPYFYDYSGFLESQITYKKFSAILGVQLLNREDFLKTSSSNSVFNPRFGIVYTQSASKNFRANFSTAYRIPSPFYGYNSNFIFSNAPLEIFNTPTTFQPEKTYNVEIGYRWGGKNAKLDVNLFHTKTKNSINYSENFYTINDDLLLNLGWNNDEFSEKTINGLQFSYLLKTDINQNIKLQNKLCLNYMFGNESFTYSDVNLENLSTNLKKIEIPFLNFQPEFMVKFQNELNFKNWSLLINHQWMGKRATYISSTETYLDTNLTHLPSFYLADLRVNYQTSKNSIFSFSMNNVFNTKYAGIRANQMNDALVYNPQPLRNWFVRVTYFLD